MILDWLEPNELYELMCTSKQLNDFIKGNKYYWTKYILSDEMLDRRRSCDTVLMKDPLEIAKKLHGAIMLEPTMEQMEQLLLANSISRIEIRAQCYTFDSLVDSMTSNTSLHTLVLMDNCMPGCVIDTEKIFPKLSIRKLVCIRSKKPCNTPFKLEHALTIPTLKSLVFRWSAAYKLVDPLWANKSLTDLDIQGLVSARDYIWQGMAKNTSIRRLNATGVVGLKRDTGTDKYFPEIFVYNTTLRDVIARNIGITSVTTTKLKIAKNIVKLDISSNTLKLAGAKGIAEFLETDNRLEALYISNCSITQTGFNIIAASLRKAKRLIHFEANANDLKNEESMLNTLSCNTKLRRLSLVSNAFANTTGWEECLKKNKTLVSIDLSYNEVELTDGRAITKRVDPAQWKVFRTEYRRNLKAIPNYEG